MTLQLVAHRLQSPSFEFGVWDLDYSAKHGKACILLQTIKKYDIHTLQHWQLKGFHVRSGTSGNLDCLLSLYKAQVVRRNSHLTTRLLLWLKYILEYLRDPIGTKVDVILKISFDWANVMLRSPFICFVWWGAQLGGTEQNRFRQRHRMPNASRCFGQIEMLRWLSLVSNIPKKRSGGRSRQT